MPTQVAGDLHGGTCGRDARPRDCGERAVSRRSGARSTSMATRLEHFALMVPESSLREGRNSLELYEVVARNKLRRLGPTSSRSLHFRGCAHRTARVLLLAAAAGGRGRPRMAAPARGAPRSGVRPWCSSSSTSSPSTTCCARTAGSTPRASRTSRSSRPPRPGSASGTTIYDSTTKAVPAILDARLPQRGRARRAGHRQRLPRCSTRSATRIEAASPVTLAVPPEHLRRSSHPRDGRDHALRGNERPASADRWAAPIQDRPADALRAPCAAPARALDLPALGTPEPAPRQRPGRRDQPADRLPRPACSPTTTTCATSSRSAPWTATSAS